MKTQSDNDARSVPLHRFVGRWDIVTSDRGKTMTTTVECNRLTASLYADRMTQRAHCLFVSITPNGQSAGTAD